MNRADRVAGWTRPSVRTMRPYYQAPLEGNPLRLDQNTNLYGPNPAVTKVGSVDVSQYPTRDSDALRHALAARDGLRPSNYVCANGSDELLDLLAKAFTTPGKRMVTLAPSYSLYPYYAQLAELELVQVPFIGGPWKPRFDVDQIIAAAGRLTVLATPDNPTGVRISVHDLRRLLDEIDGIVVADEAYIEYAGQSMISEVDNHDNLVVMRTLSKAYGLAGLRVGYLAANEDLAKRLAIVKAPYNVNSYSEAVAVAALGETPWVDGVVADTVAERERLTVELTKRGFRVVPSTANFLLTEAPIDADHLHKALRDRRILARTFRTVAGMNHAIRFTVGTTRHTDLLLTALDDILEVGV